MKAVILAAGKGVRINGATGGSPKCLLTVGGVTLIERQIKMLRLCGISDIIAVVGCGADLVQRACGTDCDYVINERFETTNSLYSLWLCRERLRDGFVVLNGDVLFDERLLNLLLTSPHDDSLLFEPSINPLARLGDEEMKVKVRGGMVVEIAKSIDPNAADGENVGIAKFGREGADLLIECMDLLISSGRHNSWVPQAFQEFALRRPLIAIPTRCLPWIEIDFVEDYQKASTEILPMLQPLSED
ncbi:MAG TPA: phosphocholine cytidylyltransferase family protein [Pyrinomonadaceae bacterium]|nr:phosphocholine cytidylyltransferase family protein [Pyrinomonadaceae bacterium]